MEKCLFFSRRFGLRKLFELHGIPESSYISMYEAHHNNKARKKSNTNEDSVARGKDEQLSKRRPSSCRKGNTSDLGTHGHLDKIVKIQSRVRGIIGRQNSEKLRLELEKGKEEVKRRNDFVSCKKPAESKPRRSSIHANRKRMSISVTASSTNPVLDLDETAVKIQKRIRGVIGRQNSEKMKIEKSNRRSSVI